MPGQSEGEGEGSAPGADHPAALGPDHPLTVRHRDPHRARPAEPAAPVPHQWRPDAWPRSRRTEPRRLVPRRSLNKPIAGRSPTSRSVVPCGRQAGRGKQDRHRPDTRPVSAQWDRLGGPSLRSRPGRVTTEADSNARWSMATSCANAPSARVRETGRHLRRPEPVGCGSEIVPAETGAQLPRLRRPQAGVGKRVGGPRVWVSGDRGAPACADHHRRLADRRAGRSAGP